MSGIDGFQMDFSCLDGKKIEKEPQGTPETTERNRRSVVTHRGGKRHLTRKAASEAALEASLDRHFREGDCYHCFSFGDVDSMSYFKHVLHQQRVEYLALSTWCMAGEDVNDLREWHRRGLLGRVDLFVGEIFCGSYPEVYAMAKEMLAECGGRLVVFRNHSKVMAIKGERFDCLIESSANVNTNPRSENTVLTVDTALVESYIKLFSEIVPFNKDFGAEPYWRPEEGGEDAETKEGTRQGAV